MKSAAILLSAISIAAVAAAQIPAQEPAPSERDWSEIYLAESPSVSPDGSFFVFAWCGRIWSAPTSGGTVIPLGDGVGTEKSPVLSPDGKKVAFLSSRAGADMPFELSLGAGGLSAGGLRQLSFHTQGCVPCAYSERDCAFSPDGETLYYLSDHGDGADVWRARRADPVRPRRSPERYGSTTATAANSRP